MGLRAIADDLFVETADGSRLIGSKCVASIGRSRVRSAPAASVGKAADAACSTVVFPQAASCPRCGSEEMEDHLLAPRGTLFTFTTQGFLPKEPYTGPETEDDFTGYALGYVALPGEVMVETRLTESDVSRLTIGMEMELVLVPFRTDPDGVDVMMFAFQPATGGASESEPNLRSERSE